MAPDSESQRLRSELLEVRHRLLGRYGLDSLIGRGPAHRRLFDQVAAAAASTVPVLVVGEPGTGKRLVARTIHQLGETSQAPFIPLDSAALPSEVLERRVVRARRGVWVRLRAPRFVLPEGSTLLIGEVLDLPRNLQGRITAALDGRVRLIATTASDPDASLAAERLRADLYYAASRPWSSGSARSATGSTSCRSSRSTSWSVPTSAAAGSGAASATRRSRRS